MRKSSLVIKRFYKFFLHAAIVAIMRKPPQAGSCHMRSLLVLLQVPKPCHVMSYRSRKHNGFLQGYCPDTPNSQYDQGQVLLLFINDLSFQKNQSPSYIIVSPVNSVYNAILACITIPCTYLFVYLFPLIFDFLYNSSFQTFGSKDSFPFLKLSSTVKKFCLCSSICQYSSY